MLSNVHQAITVILLVILEQNQRDQLITPHKMVLSALLVVIVRYLAQVKVLPVLLVLSVMERV